MSDDAQPATDVPAGEPPAVIHSPDQSQLPSRKRGRHFGPRPVDDPHSAWMPPWRVTPALRAKVLAEIKVADLSYSAFMRARFGEKPGPRARRNPGPDTVLLAKLLAELGKSGSNLNQIARRLNEYDFDGIPELQAMRAEHEEALEQHGAVCEAIMAALGA
jgi:hypothetical protein